MRLQRLNFGRTIVTRGEPSTKLFFLAEGEVRLSFRESHSAQEISAAIASATSGFNAHTNDKMEAFKQQQQQEALVDLHGRAVQSLADSGEFPKISSAASSDKKKAKPHVEKKNHAKAKNKQNKVEQEVNFDFNFVVYLVQKYDLLDSHLLFFEVGVGHGWLRNCKGACHFWRRRRHHGQKYIPDHSSHSKSGSSS